MTLKAGYNIFGEHTTYVFRAEMEALCLFEGEYHSSEVGPRLLTVEVRFRAPRGICSGRSGSGTGFSPSSSDFRCIIPQQANIHSLLMRFDNGTLSGRSSIDIVPAPSQ